MDIEINKNSKIPLYLQIEECLKRLIKEGQIEKGSQLPTERELSDKLGVSRNTVSTAYQELAREKVITSISGKGTFVISNGNFPKTKMLRYNSLSLIKHIDKAIEKALEQNIPFEDFMFLINQRLKDKSHLLNNVNIAFIECNQEQLYYFSKKLELGTGIHIIPVLIDEMYSTPANFLKQIESADLVVTTFFHLQEVKEFLKDTDKKIIAIALDPQIETMVNIARAASPNMKVGLVCITDNFAERVFKSIKIAGIKYRKLSYTITRDNDKIKEFIHNCDILISSPGRKKIVKKYINNSKPLIEFIYIPDKGSIDTLMNKILDIKRER